MIETLHVGMRILLSSGNVVRLLRCEDDEWVCEYTELSRARGEVVFTGRFLRKHGTQV
jgi:hypothetical protein